MLVADDGDGLILGFACSSRFHPRAAYETSVMTSIYLDPECRSAGLGSKLYAALLDLFTGIDVHRAYAGITLPNPASEALHRKFGFTKAAHYTEAGRKFGRYWDVVWYELALPWKPTD
jgi:phosphinothricin acetyltransferase